MASFLNAPHPLLTTPTLYLADPPGRVKWQHVVLALSPCGEVKAGGKSSAPGNRKKWIVHFKDLFHAEMALVTLQGTMITQVNPPWKMVLSHSPNLEPTLPQVLLFPQFVKPVVAPHPLLEESSLQTLFTIFRNAGPLVSLRKGVNIGYAQPMVVVEYWKDEHANNARTRKQDLHELTQNSPPFVLRTFDPFNLYCVGFESTLQAQDMRSMFSQYGTIKEVVVKKNANTGSFGFVSFTSREAAAAALQRMNGKAIGGRVILVRYHEPSAQNIFRWPPRAQQSAKPTDSVPPADLPTDAGESGPSQKSEAADQHAAEESGAEQHKANQQPREAAARKAEGLAQRATARKAEEAKRVHFMEKRRRREEAERSELIAQKKREDTEKEAAEAQRLHVIAEEALTVADDEMQAASRAFTEAKRAWLAAIDQQTHAAVHLNDKRLERDEALQRKRMAEASVTVAEQEEAVYRAEREAAEREEKDADIGYSEEERKEEEEAQRQAELQESIRKIEELQRLEEADRLAKEKAKAENIAEAQRRKEEAERLERERKVREQAEAERRAREAKEREERERQEAARRQREYVRAAAAERGRCLERDRKGNYAWFGNWRLENIVKRFIAVSAEFDDIKFGDAQPLTYESVPWPTVMPPHRARLEDIDWSTVEDFFVVVQQQIPDKIAYKSIVEKTHRRFHPDKWRARGLLRTVLDEKLRSQLEEKGNVVAQALTPIWLKAKESL